MFEPLPPWLQTQWAALDKRRQDGNLPHALLIEGPAGIGKYLFARFAAHALLCTEASEQGACGQCSSCVLLRSQSHPDINEISPAQDSAVIKIDQIRDMVAWLQLTRQYHSYKIAIVSPADAMNRNAANSLLKTLEEPAANSVILLLAEQRGVLPPTVVSRCQRVTLGLTDRPSALTWLASQGVENPSAALSLAADGPLLATADNQAELADTRQRLFSAWQNILLGKASVAKSVESIEDIPTRSCLTLMSSWVADITRLQVDQNAYIRHSDLRCELSALSYTLATEQWFTLYDQLLQLFRSDSASIKTQAVLEGIFADIRLNQKKTS